MLKVEYCEKARHKTIGFEHKNCVINITGIRDPAIIELLLRVIEPCRAQMWMPEHYNQKAADEIQLLLNKFENKLLKKTARCKKIHNMLGRRWEE